MKHFDIFLGGLKLFNYFVKHGENVANQAQKKPIHCWLDMYLVTNHAHRNRK